MNVSVQSIDHMVDVWFNQKCWRQLRLKFGFSIEKCIVSSRAGCDGFIGCPTRSSRFVDLFDVAFSRLVSQDPA